MPRKAPKKPPAKAPTRARAQTRAKKPPAKPAQTMGDKVVAFIQKYLRIPDGMHMGKPVVLDDFQLRFIRDIWDNPAGTRQAIFSAGRKNAKTAIIAMIVLACLVGPCAVENSEIESGAMSRDQAAKVFNYCVKMIRQSPDLQGLIHVIPSHKTLEGLTMNTSYRALSADAQNAHGGSPRVAIMDELGQVRGPRSDFFDAIETSQGAHADPLLIIISTQAANDGDLLSMIIDDALESGDPQMVCHLYTAPKDCKLMDKKAWRAANPAMGKFLSEESIRKAAEKAVRMPSNEGKFRNLILNQRVESASPLFSRDAWAACGATADKPMVPITMCTHIYGGLDLSGRLDLTAYVLIGLYEGIWYVYPYFWTPEVGLKERARRDRSHYDVWAKQGLIKTTPSASIKYEFVAKDIGEINASINVNGIAYDRWRMDMLKKELEDIGLELPMDEWGQGFKDMAPAVDSIEEMVVNQTIRHDNNPVLTMCIANVVVIADSTSNRKMDKRKATGRIDGAVAVTMAAGISQRDYDHDGPLDDFINKPLVL